MRTSILLYLSLCLVSLPAQGANCVTDDNNRQLCLEQPARRIVSLAPYLTELLFVAGAGDYAIGVSEFSDYPAAARDIKRIGSGTGLDLERIVQLQPDLVLAWQSGNPIDQVELLRKQGLQVFVSEPRSLGDVSDTLLRLGELTAMQGEAGKAASSYRQRLASLRAGNSGKTIVDVFYQVWDRPLMTVNGDHIISDVIRLCAGRNIFAGLGQLAPQVGIEAVIELDPQVMIGASGDTGAFDQWQKWRGLKAVRGGHLYSVAANTLVRHTPRILDGAERVCGILDKVRRDNL